MSARVTAVLAGLMAGLVALTPGPAAAAATDVCVVSDPRATELSGLVATSSGYVSINDSNLDPARIRIFYLDRACAVTRTLAYPTAARDPEDLAVGPDGALWVADIGDNITSPTRRSSIALWRVPPGGGPPVIHRMTYPDGPHDAEALLFTGAGLPVVVTKEISGQSGIYQASGPLEPDTAAGVPLRRVGVFAPTATGIENPFGRIGEVLVTGAGTAPDRRRIVLRTYTAAYEWDVPDGDVVKAITTTPPRLTPLPDEAQGESIAYTTDGAAFLTVSDRTDGPVTIRRITPSAARSTGPTASPTAVAETSAVTPASTRPAITVWSAAGLGLLLVLLLGLVLRRRSVAGAGRR